MLPIAQDVYRAARRAHEDLYKALQELEKGVPANSQEENTDSIYALREAYKFMEDSRKMMDRVNKLVKAVVCVQWLNTSGENIETAYCTGKPDIKVRAKIPKWEDDPAAYNALMDYLGVDPICRDSGKFISDRGEEHTEVLSVHWPGFQSLIARLCAQGLPLPPGIDPQATWNENEVGIRKRKGVLD